MITKMSQIVAKVKDFQCLAAGCGGASIEERNIAIIIIAHPCKATLQNMYSRPLETYSKEKSIQNYQKHFGKKSKMTEHWFG